MDDLLTLKKDEISMIKHCQQHSDTVDNGEVVRQLQTIVSE